MLSNQLTYKSLGSSIKLEGTFNIKSFVFIGTFCASLTIVGKLNIFWLNEIIIQFIIFVSFCIRKHSGIRVSRDLGDVCQKMWNAAGNNMVVGTDMTVDTSTTATNLFTVTSTGQNKLRQPVYTSFKGKSYSTSLLFYVIYIINRELISN